MNSMATYIGFLRAINLGATRKFPKEAIIRATEAAGFAEVATYINTGNVRFDTSLRSRSKIESALEAAYLVEAGFEVPAIVFTTAEFREIAAYAETLGEPERHYISLLKKSPTAAGAKSMEAMSRDAEQVNVRGRAVHLLYDGTNYREAKITNTQVEKVLGVSTNRNLTVVKALSEKWC